MKELDLLKKDWNKNTHTFEQVPEREIYGMIHKKSSSIVKWILVISLLEFLLWISVNTIFNADDYLEKIAQSELIVFFKTLTFLNYGVVLFFIYLFYKNYTAISTTVATKELMKAILKTKKTVQYYVWYNLGMVCFSFILGIIITFAYNPEISNLKTQHANYGMVMGITTVILLVFLVVILGLFWLFYKLLYGLLLNRLYKNYKELEKVEL